jgi:hypothetical protein
MTIDAGVLRVASSMARERGGRWASGTVGREGEKEKRGAGTLNTQLSTLNIQRSTFNALHSTLYIQRPTSITGTKAALKTRQCKRFARIDAAVVS